MIAWGRGKEWKGEIAKGEEETFGNKVYFHYLDHGDCFMSIQIY